MSDFEWPPKKSCNVNLFMEKIMYVPVSNYDKYPIITWALTILGGAGFLPTTVLTNLKKERLTIHTLPQCILDSPVLLWESFSGVS